MAMIYPWLIWSALLNTARLSTVLQILLFLPLTLATLSRQAFLLHSLLLSLHAVIHGTLVLIFGSEALAMLQVPMHPTILLVCFNAFSSSVHPWLCTVVEYWGTMLTLSGPVFTALEGLSSLIVAQKLGRAGKRLVAEEDGYQFGLLIAAAVAYVVSAYWIYIAYPGAASSPLNATLVGVALTSLFFLTFIGFGLRRTNIIESSGICLFVAYNLWLCGFDNSTFADQTASYAPLLPNLIPHIEALLNFVTNTIPKRLLIALLYRLGILHFASRVLPSIGADSWDEDGVDDNWDGRPTSTLTKILLTYRQFIFVSVYSLLLLDAAQQTWYRWMNIALTLIIWSVELLVSGEDGEDELVTKQWKID